MPVTYLGMSKAAFIRSTQSVKASTACVRAPMPVCPVMEVGRPRELGVVHRKARYKHKVVNGVLVVRLVIGDNRRERDFASRTGGSGNRNKQRQETVDAQQAAHLVDGLVWLRDACSHALGTVHGRATAKADNGLAGALSACSRMRGSV